MAGAVVGVGMLGDALLRRAPELPGPAEEVAQAAGHRDSCEVYIRDYVQMVTVRRPARGEVSGIAVGLPDDWGDS